MTQPILRRRFLLSAGMGSVSLLGCTLHTDYNHDASDAPRQVLAPRPGSRPLKNIWVLSSGGPRGFVHVGILKALEELGHKPDAIVGGSVGALIGALYAGGVSSQELEQMSLDLGVTDMGRLALTGDGKFAGTPLAGIVNRELIKRCGTCELEKLPIPFAAVAVERQSKKPVLFNTGDAGVAVQASCAIEEMFTPVRIRGMQYVDADQVMPLPVRLAREWVSSMQGTSKETARVLAMDASARPEAAPPGAERFRESDLRKRALIAQDAPSASLMLHPEMSYFVNVSQAFRLKTIEQGYQQTLARAEQIKAALNSK
jgi:NTE family protein